MTSPEHLLPCPWCDRTDNLFLHHLGDDDSWNVECEGCQLSQHSVWTREQAIAAWNRRAATPAAADVNAKAAGLHEPAVVQEKRDEPAAADEWERVARAMYSVNACFRWDSEADSVRWEYLELARAAIAAMNRTAAAATEDMPRGEYEAHVAQYAKANRELRLRAEKSESDVAVERAFHRKLVDERDSWFALFDEVSRHLGCNARCLVDGNPHVIERARYLSSMFTGDRYVATERAERERDAAMKRAEVAEALMGTEVDRNTLKLMSISADASYKMAVLERDDARAEVERLREAILRVLDDSESQPGGWGPDVTMQAVLREALA